MNCYKGQLPVPNKFNSTTHWPCNCEIWHSVYDLSFTSTNIFNRLVSNYQFNARFLYSITIYVLHYNSRYISSSTMLIFRRSNCIITESGIVTLCKGPYGTPVESGLESALNRRTVRPFTESDDTRFCNNTIWPPEDEHSTARNISRIIV